MRPELRINMDASPKKAHKLWQANRRRQLRRTSFQVFAEDYGCRTGVEHIRDGQLVCVDYGSSLFDFNGYSVVRSIDINSRLEAYKQILWKRAGGK